MSVRLCGICTINVAVRTDVLDWMAIHCSDRHDSASGVLVLDAEKAGSKDLGVWSESAGLRVGEAMVSWAQSKSWKWLRR